MNLSFPSPSAKRLPGSSTRLLTTISNIGIGAIFALFALAAWNSWRTTGDIRLLILAFQELLIVGLVVTRHPNTRETRALWDWVVAIVGTIAPLFLRAAPTTISVASSIGLGIQLIGAILATIAVFSLWRSFGIVAALRTVRTTGFYSVVRHPLYASYLVSYIGFLIANPSTYNISLILVATFCQYIRAIAEERILMNDPAYRTYIQQVHYRFIPFVL